MTEVQSPPATVAYSQAVEAAKEWGQPRALFKWADIMARYILQPQSDPQGHSDRTTTDACREFVERVVRATCQFSASCNDLLLPDAAIDRFTTELHTRLSRPATVPDTVLQAAERMRSKWNLTWKIVDSTGDFLVGYIADLTIIVDHWLKENQQ